MKRTSLFLFVLLFALSLGTTATFAASVEPQFFDGNPSCADLGYASGFKPQPEPPPTGDYSDGVITVHIDSDGTYFSWSSSHGIDAVIVKGGDNANVYVYDPESTADSGLSAPINANNGSPFEISHIDFCYDIETPPPVPHVTVTKTANTSFTRTWTWTIDKTADQSELTLPNKASSLYAYYTVVVTASTPIDSDHMVSGEIWVTNDGTVPAEVTAVSDTGDGIGSPTPSCDGGLPQTLAVGGVLHCTYSASSTGANGTNTADATVTGGTSTPGTAPITFGDPTTKVDECVNVTDSLAGSLGTVCANESPKTIHYSVQVGPYDSCGDKTVNNTATFLGASGATGSDSASVIVHVRCVYWCSPGYWSQNLSVTNTYFDTGKLYSTIPGGAPLKKGSPANPSIGAVLASPSIYGGPAFNSVGDYFATLLGWGGTQNYNDGCPIDAHGVWVAPTPAQLPSVPPKLN